MARLVNAKTGVTVEVADEKVVRLGSEWAPEKKSEPKSSAKPKATTKS